MESLNSTDADAVIETLRKRGWFIDNLEHVKALILLQSALADDLETSTVANSVESELVNTDLRSIGGKSLPDPHLLRNSFNLRGPIVLQISAVRDISRSSSEEFLENSSIRRVLRLILTDGQSEITAIEYSHIPSLPNSVVPGTKVRLENKVKVCSGIACLNPKVIVVLGGVVQSLYDEWEMNRKYSGFSRSSLPLSQGSDADGPPPFEKLQIQAPSKTRFTQPDYRGSTSKNAGPATSYTDGNTESSSHRRHQTSELKPDNGDNGLKTPSFMERTEEKPSSSETRPKEVAESVPVQNQAASQKLLQKMSQSNPDGSHYRGRRNKGKGKQEEPVVFTLDEWEKRNASSKPQMKNELPDTSNDEDIAWQLQNQLDLRDDHVQKKHDRDAENIRLSMFNYEREDSRVYQAEHGRRGRGKGRGRGRGGGRRGRGRGRFG